MGHRRREFTDPRSSTPSTRSARSCWPGGSTRASATCSPSARPSSAASRGALADGTRPAPPGLVLRRLHLRRGREPSPPTATCGRSSRRAWRRAATPSPVAARSWARSARTSRRSSSSSTSPARSGRTPASRSAGSSPPTTKLDPANASSGILTQAIEILQDPDTTFRFDASDLMPGAVGSGRSGAAWSRGSAGRRVDQVAEQISRPGRRADPSRRVTGGGRPSGRPTPRQHAHSTKPAVTGRVDLSTKRPEHRRPGGKGRR